jgi:uridine kinase
MKQTIIVGVAGGSGSGKSTVVRKLARMLGNDTLTIAHDNYYRDGLKKLNGQERANYDHPSSLETELLVEHLEMLKKGVSVEQPLYDFARDARSGEVEVLEPKRIVLVEGILLFESEALRNMFNLMVYVDTEADERFIRRLRRDTRERGRSVESVISQYLETVKPMHEMFVEPSKKFADVVIKEGGYNRLALDGLMERIDELRHG